MVVHECNSQEEFDQKLKTDKLVVVDFTATWCGPCQMIKPKFAEFSENYTEVVFLKVDVDVEANSKICEKYSISCMPTFIFIKNGEKIDDVTGADPATLETKIKQHK